MKVAKACYQCRVGKRRCGEGEQGLPCAPCLKRGLGCSLAQRSRGHPVSIRPPIAPTTPTVTDHELSLDLPTTLMLVNLYLELIHNKPHTLFHPASLLLAVEQGTVVPHVLYGILALICRFAPDTHPGLRSRGGAYHEKAKTCLKNELDSLSVENVQACILIGNYCGVERRPELEAFYVGMACRIAIITRLHEPLAGDDHIQREVRLRTWWSLYMMDRWGSAGKQLPRQLPDKTPDGIPLPMEESSFFSLRAGSPVEHTDFPRPGLWGRMVQLAEIFTMVHDLNRERAQGCRTYQEAEWRTYELAADLDKWQLSLPPDLIPNEENMRRHAQQGLGSVFVALHMGFYHYTNLLYFPFLDLQLEKTPTQILFSDRCRHSAAAFSDFLAMSDEIEGCEVVYFIVAHMITVSSAALLHVLLFGHETELPATRERLERNFKTLVKLAGYWPAVNQLMDRLFTFQRACMSSTDPNTHKADSWMIGFLLDHARPVAERVEQTEQAGPSTADMVQRDRVAKDTLSLLRV